MCDLLKYRKHYTACNITFSRTQYVNTYRVHINWVAMCNHGWFKSRVIMYSYTYRTWIRMWPGMRKQGLCAQKLATTLYSPCMDRYPCDVSIVWTYISCELSWENQAYVHKIHFFTLFHLSCLLNESYKLSKLD